MKRGVFLAESPLDSHRPLGAFGQPVHMSYVQLRAAVAQRLGERHANLFARPQIDDRSGVIRWVAPIDGEPRRWADLDPQEQADRALDLQIMKAEFDTYLADLKSAEGGKAFASVLENALQTPNDGHLHFVGDQPVMTFWGFTELGGESFTPLTAAPPVAAPAAAGVAPAAVAGAPARGVPVWLWWLLPLLLLLLLLLWWLFWSDDKPTPPVVDPVETTEPVEDVEPEVLEESPPFERLDDGRIRLRDGRIVDRDDLGVDEDGRVIGPDGEVLEDVPPDALGLDEDGALTDPPAIEEPLPEEGDGTDIPEDAPVDPGAEEGTENPPLPEEEPEGGAEDDLGEDAPGEDPAADEPLPEPPAPEEAPAPEGPEEAAPQDEAPVPGEELEIPDPAASGGAGSDGADDANGAPAPFMEGEWRSRSGLTDENGAPLDQRYEFDDNGQGQSVIRRADGVRCTAPAEARMRDGKLVMVEKSNPTCPDGREFQRSETVCERGADGKTRCQGDGFDVRIERNKP